LVDVAVFNNSGAAILTGQVVRQTGFVQPQQLPSIALASAAVVTTATVFGIATEVIANNTAGQVRVSGSYGPLDTSTFIVGAKVFLSDTPGEISSTPGTIESAIGNVEVAALAGCVYITCIAPTASCSTSSGTGDDGATGLQGVTGIGTAGSGVDQLHMNVLGPLEAIPSLPFVEVGPEISGTANTFVIWRGRRLTPGTAGTTTIQLELNDVPVVGAILSWTPADAASALMTVGIALVVAVGDKISFRITSFETGGTRDIITEINS